MTSIAEIIIRGFIAWAVINTLLMVAFIVLMWRSGRGSERDARCDAATARQLGGWR